MKTEVLLTQTGYLTFKVIRPNGAVLLDYPNQEVAASMARLYADQLLGFRPYFSSDPRSLQRVLSEAPLEAVVARFNEVFNALDYARYPVRDEATCRAYLQVLMTGADMVPNVEVHHALGHSDIEVNAGDRHWVFEIKFARSASDVEKLLDEGREQVEHRRYGLRPGATKLLRPVLVFSQTERQFVAWANAAHGEDAPLTRSDA